MTITKLVVYSPLLCFVTLIWACHRGPDIKSCGVRNTNTGLTNISLTKFGTNADTNRDFVWTNIAGTDYVVVTNIFTNQNLALKQGNTSMQLFGASNGYYMQIRNITPITNSWNNWNCGMDWTPTNIEVEICSNAVVSRATNGSWIVRFPN